MPQDHPETVKGPGLARGPALVIGMVLAVFGLILFFSAAGAPLSTTGFRDAQVQGQRFASFEANAWTAWLTTAAGVLLLCAAAQHLVAKTMSLLVGLTLGAASVIALVDGDDVLGLAAANGLTALGWGVAAALLLSNTLAPRVRHKKDAGRRRPDAETRVAQRADHEPAPRFADLRSPDPAQRDAPAPDSGSVQLNSDPAATSRDRQER